ncbi:MAG: isochorismate synthase [Acidobacteriota bacterium]
MSGLSGLAPAPRTAPAFEPPPVATDARTTDARIAMRDFVHQARIDCLAAVPADLQPLLALTVPAPRVVPETLLRIASGAMPFLWHPPRGAAVAGSGVAWSTQAAGAHRIADVRRAAETLWPRLFVARHPALRGVARRPPRLYGGFAFAPLTSSTSADDPWSSFGDAAFSLPRLRYMQGNPSAEHGGDAATLTLTVGLDVLDALPDGVERIADELLELQTALTRTGQLLTSHAPGRILAVQALDPTRWRTQVEAVRTVIRAGDVRKIVLARRSVVELADPPRAGRILARLADGLVACTRFAFLRPDATFLGATPERLIARRGLRVETEALAGSLPLGEEARLLDSPKDAEEHALVVEAILEHLRPLCRELDVPDAPGIRRLREVLHLRTPIRGVLRRPVHVLDLVERLHPTPAVGGVPTAEALGWIADQEGVERGWYAGPIGWFDGDGDGDFGVALRSCMLAGRRAYVYAGAGLVADSDPALEYAETALKQRSILAALGAPD